MSHRLKEIISFIIGEILGGKDPFKAQPEIAENLMDQGYSLKEIDSAFDQMFSFIAMEWSKTRSKPTASKRIFHHLERLKLNVPACGFLIAMHEAGFITPLQREEIIEQALASSEEVGLEEIKRIAGQVVFGDPFHKWKEDLKQ